MSVRFAFDIQKAMSPEVAAAIRKRWAFALETMVLERIESGGDDEIRFAPLAFGRIDKSRDRPLYHTGAHLRSSITSGVTGNAAWVGSNMRGSRVLQHGTKGKRAPGVGQGTLPTIVPRNAKALFIPLTARAQNSVRVPGPPVRRVPSPAKGRKGSRKQNVPVVDLRRGEDFILVSKVDLPPRPFLRLSREDRRRLARIITKGK